MIKVKVDVAVDAPPEKTWEVVSNPRNLSRWDRHITSVTGVPKGGLEKGSSYETEIRFMGVRSKISAKVLDLDPPKRSRIRLSGLLDATVETRVSALDGGDRSLLEHDVEYSFGGGPIGAIAAHGLRLTGGASAMIRRGAMRQKRQAETEG